IKAKCQSLLFDSFQNKHPSYAISINYTIISYELNKIRQGEFMNFEKYSLKNKFKQNYAGLNRRIDLQLIYVTLLLSLFGILIISTATKSYGTLNFVKKQSI